MTREQCMKLYETLCSGVVCPIGNDFGLPTYILYRRSTVGTLGECCGESNWSDRDKCGVIIRVDLLRDLYTRYDYEIIEIYDLFRTRE
jgi:hypothetical protein